VLDFHYGYDLHRERIAKLEQDALLYSQVRAARAARPRPRLRVSFSLFHRRPRVVARPAC
jgi:hypothetical protein